MEDLTLHVGLFVVVLAVVVAGGSVFFVQQVSSTPGGGLPGPWRREFGPDPGQKVHPRLDSLEYVYGGGVKVIARGSGFTSDGNSQKIKGTHFVEPLRSSDDGRTIVFRMSASYENFPGGAGYRGGQTDTYCPPGETCTIQVRMVNGYGLDSNSVNFGWQYPDTPLRVEYGPARGAPGPQTVTPGATDVEVLRYTVKSDEHNWDDLQFGSAFLLLLPTTGHSLDCEKTFAGLKLSDGTRELTVPDYGVYPWNEPYPLGFAVPSGSCAATFWVPEDLRAQWDPLNIFLAPGQERVLSFRLSIPVTAPAGTTFRAYATLTQYENPYPGAVPDRFGNPVTIASP